MTRYSGKRPRTRPPSAAALMRRTRSTALLDSVLDVDQHNEKYKKHKQRPEDGGASRKSAALTSLQIHGFPEAAHFLEACSLCKRRLGPGTDIYMYRGDSAFCSAECRHEQIVIDELREKCYLAVTKIEESSAAANHIQSSAKKSERPSRDSRSSLTKLIRSDKIY